MNTMQICRSDFTVAGVVISRPGEPDRVLPEHSTYKIRIAGGVAKNSTLLSRMYARRGYSVPATITHSPYQSTVVVHAAEDAVGTITVNIDNGNNFAAAELYPDVVGRFRQEGAQLCEFGKLAVDESVKSKQVLAAMFHVAVILSYYVRGATDVLIEVNPKHVAFYRRGLGFAVVGEERHCARVNAPAVLLHLSLETLAGQARRLGGKPHLAATERSFYPYFFSEKEETGIFRRLFNAALSS